MYGIALLVLSTMVMSSLLINVTGFATPPGVGQSNLQKRANPRSMKRSPKAQRSSLLALAEDTSTLPDIARGVFEQDKRPVLLYDGVCNMCNGFVNLFLDVDKDEKFRFSALQSQTGRALLSLSGRSPDDISR